MSSELARRIARRIINANAREGNAAMIDQEIGDDALMPFAQLGGGCSISDTAAYHDLEDDVVVYSSAGKAITAGDVRAVRQAIYATREHGPEASCSPT